eukprot:893642_1
MNGDIDDTNNTNITLPSSTIPVQIQELARQQMENRTTIPPSIEQYKNYQLQQVDIQQMQSDNNNNNDNDQQQQQHIQQQQQQQQQHHQHDPSDLDNTNLYVKGLWKDCTQIELDDLFKSFGVISQSRVYGDGVGFVRFEQGFQAKQALEQMNGAKLDRCQDQLLVKYAFRKPKNTKRYIRVGDEVKQYEVEMIMNKNTNNVYLRCLPRNFTESQLTALCTPYGELTCTRLRESGVAFVRYRKAKDAQVAIRELNGKKFDGQQDALLAKLANSDPFQPKIDFKQRNDEQQQQQQQQQQHQRQHRGHKQRHRGHKQRQQHRGQHHGQHTETRQHKSKKGGRMVSKNRKVGRWFLGETLGKGGYSWVKKGYDRKDGRVVALKFTSKAKGDWSASQSKQIQNEIEALRQIKDKHVLQLLAYNLNAKYPQKDGLIIPSVLLVLEYLPGGELFDILYYTSALTEKIARTYFK